MRSLLARVAATAPVPVFAAIGEGERDAVEDLALDARIQLVETPRHANVLLIAGRLPPRLLRPALRVHDQMSRPRATVCWPVSVQPQRPSGLFQQARIVEEGEDVGAVIAAVHSDLLRGTRGSEPVRQPDVPPRPWRGVGPHGQGGKGMTGGAPYGRPLAGRAPDRDGLELDQLSVRVGPFVPAFPPGLCLDVKLQGDIVQEVAVGPNPFAVGSRSLDPFRRALHEPVPLAELERARARSHLRAVARTLRFHGLHGLADRLFRLQGRLPASTAVELRSLGSLLERTRALAWATDGIGHLDASAPATVGLGPVTRAAGAAEDLRAREPAYLSLGFELLSRQGGDARARWRQRLAEAIQSLELAERAGEMRIGPLERVEGPRGLLGSGRDPSAALLELLSSMLPGQEWGHAAATVVSLDIDVEEAAA